MKEKAGSLLGGILLIGGSSLGAGMLALPIVTGLSGFGPSLLMLVAAWAFMTITGLLMVEVNGWFPSRVNIISMAEKSLGKTGKALAWLLYLFLFYSLLVAYITGSGALASAYARTYTTVAIPPWMGSLFFVIAFGLVVYRGTRTVDYWNRILIVGKITAYVAMVMLGFSYVEPAKLLYSAPAAAFYALPVLIIAFGYHNMIPTITAYMQGDVKRVRLVIVAGSLFSLCVYLVWNFVVLGVLPIDGPWGILSSWKEGRLASDAIAGLLGMAWMTTAAEWLAFFALLSSFLAQTLALVHFLADGFKISGEKHESIGLCCGALLPPLFVALLNPKLFLAALGFAGGVCAVILFGVMPVLMVWKGRYQNHQQSAFKVFGGKPLLALVFIFAVLILFFQLSSMFHASYLPQP